uniref:Large ribosomal subunit protein uL22c n=1 Tax=Atriplex gmelinii TaxID=118074 RepID=A0A8K1KU08_9CARY|nr:ribosomal protein L22 [Atriplex gmelinii]YP_010997724.1 ribosomal protein L22 [Atriplex patens]UDD86492.1 ribosomal protein L22 [Atriplex gmelinii]WMS60213.1 ribosomal protein L22 [Atriplex patens]
MEVTFMGFFKKKEKKSEFDVFRLYGQIHPEPGQCDEITARGHSISMSVDKARRVIDQIRGRSYAETLMILELMPYRACYPIFKLIYSAAANASHNKQFNKANLIISKATVNKGITLKKLKPRARGRSYLIKKPTCHITIVLRDITHFDSYEKFLERLPPKKLITSLGIMSTDQRREFLCGRFRETHKIKSFLYNIAFV